MKIRTGFVSNSSSSSFPIFVGVKERSWKLSLGSNANRGLDIDDLEALLERPSWRYDEQHFSWIYASEAREYISHLWLDDDEKAELLKRIDSLAENIDERDSYYFARVELSYHDRVSLEVFHAMVSEGIIDKIYESGD